MSDPVEEYHTQWDRILSTLREITPGSCVEALAEDPSLWRYVGQVVDECDRLMTERDRNLAALRGGRGTTTR